MFLSIRPLFRLWLVVGLSVASMAGQMNFSKGSWLDRQPIKWNMSDGQVTPIPWATEVENSNLQSATCSRQVRQPGNTAEANVAKHGWKLYGDAQTSGATSVVLGMTDADGMCRPLGYQAFVFVNGRFVGTLSPLPMNSRTDGALSTVHFVGTDGMTADFLRYKETDPLCCASSTSTVEYRIPNGKESALEVVKVTTRSNSNSQAGSSK